MIPHKPAQTLRRTVYLGTSDGSPMPLQSRWAGLAVHRSLLLAAAGIPAALILTHFLSALLFGVTATDSITFISVALLLMLVVLSAAYLPAPRAIRIDPMVPLRCE